MKSLTVGICVVLFIVIFHSLVSLSVLSNSSLIRAYDEAGYIKQSYIAADAVRAADVQDMCRFLFELDTHPKLVYGLNGVILTVLDCVGHKNNQALIVLSNALFFLILLISTFFIGLSVYDMRTALISVVLVSAVPVVFGHSRVFLVDFPLASMVTLCFFLLLKTDHFRSLTISMLAACAFFLAQMTKESAVLFVAPLFLYYGIVSYRQSKQKQTIINFVITLVLSAVLISLVYAVFNGSSFYKWYLSKSLSVHNNEHFPFYYIVGFVDWFIGKPLVFFLIPLFISMIYSIRKKNMFLLLWLLLPPVLFSFSTNRAPRFLIPIVPPLMLLSASELSKWRGKQRTGLMATIYTAVLLAAAFYQIIHYSFIMQQKEYNPLVTTGLISRYSDNRTVTVQELKKFLAADIKKTGSMPHVLFTFNTGIHSAVGVALLNEFPNVIIDCPQEADEINSPASGTIDWEFYLLTATYVIDTSGDLGDRGIYEDIGGALQAALIVHKKMFDEIGQIPCADGSIIRIFRKKHV